MENVRVRFAPSPTGIPHVGNIRTALFDYFFAKKNGGVFILRIEDTDQARKVEGAEEAIKESLKWLGADWDEYEVQSERLLEYKKYADELLAKGLAKEDEGAIRFIVPKDKTISWIDAVGNKTISYNTNDIEDFIILKKDGFPTYHLANVVDDHLMNITHVIRGEDWIPSTPKHILLYQSFGWDQPVFAHVPNVLDVTRKKLSKRHGAKTVLDFKKEGYLPEALLNCLMLLGFSPKDDREILGKSDFEKDFELEKINVAPAIFDEKGKLAWLNAEYIMKLTDDELLTRLVDFDPTLSTFDQDKLGKLVGPTKTRMKTLSDFKNLVDPFLGGIAETKNPELKKQIRERFEQISDWDQENILRSLKELMEEKNIRFPQIYKALIGTSQGLNLPEVYEILGKNETLDRLN